MRLILIPETRFTRRISIEVATHDRHGRINPAIAVTITEDKNPTFVAILASRKPIAAYVGGPPTRRFVKYRSPFYS